MTALFVTGTDTGVGKTTVAAGLLAALRRQGFRVGAVKPVETGCALVEGALVPDDARLLRDAAGLDAPLDLVAPHRYATPVAPAVAARREGRPFSLAAVEASLASVRRLAPDLTLVEGAGGLLVPYDDALLAADLVATLRLPLLVVARASLGTINHTLLTITEARRRGLSVVGVVLSRVLAERGPDEDDNAAEIERLARVRVLGTVPHLPAATRRDPAALADAVASVMDPRVLVGA